MITIDGKKLVFETTDLVPHMTHDEHEKLARITFSGKKPDDTDFQETYDYIFELVKKYNVEYDERYVWD